MGQGGGGGGGGGGGVGVGGSVLVMPCNVAGVWQGGHHRRTRNKVFVF